MSSGVTPLEQIDNLLGRIECLIDAERAVAMPAASLEGTLDKSVAVRDSANELADCVEPMKVAVEQARCEWKRINDEQQRLARAQADAIVNSAQIIHQLEETQEELQRVQREKFEIARQAGMAEVAIGVLHNVGNVLNSVNVSANLAIDQVKRGRLDGLVKAISLIDQHADDLQTFITSDEHGKHLLEYLRQLSKRLLGERDSLLDELRSLLGNIEHIKEIVSMQQSFAHIGGLVEPVDLAEVADRALKMEAPGLTCRGIEVQCRRRSISPVTTDRSKVLQILVNLISNAKHALSTSSAGGKQLTVHIGSSGDEHVCVQVEDNGIGIPSEALSRVFAHGYTTRQDGHGFGLHASALAAKQLGGSLTAHSDGPGQGATFTLLLPRTPRECDEDGEPDGLPLAGQATYDRTPRIIEVQD